MKKLQICLLMLILAIAGISCKNNNHQTASMIIKNARIWTGNPAQPYAEAMAVSGDTIVAVGSNREVLKYRADSTIVIDVDGKFITPGFIDSHVHMLQGGLDLTSVQLRGSATPEEFIKRIADFAAKLKPGTWILGGNWDEKDWGRMPEKGWIDSVTPDNPVFVSRLDGHMGLANSLAMKIAGLDRSVRDVKGGAISRNASGELTGIFRDNAMDLIYNKIPPSSEEETDNALVAAMNYFAGNGVTSVHGVDAGAYLNAIERVRNKSGLITRIYAMVPLGYWKQLAEKTGSAGKGDDWVKVGGVKGFVDGSLGSHTAAFLEPYSDLATDSGLFVNTREDLYDWISNSDSAGLQVMIHAIGDRAINYLLNTYEQVEKENGERDRRFRIEHSQHIAPSDIPRYASLKVIASMQPYHCIDDGRWAEKYIGPERIKTTYAFRSLIDAGARLAFGSDWPVAPATPLEGIYAAVTRRTLDDKNPGGWVPEQKITVDEALRAYTMDAAYASFDENIKGTLEAGKLADFVVLDKDITAIDPVTIRDVKVLQTYVAGRKVFDSNK